MNRASGPDPLDAATFLSQRVLAHPPQRVFEALARPELLARWWGPDGFTNTFDVFEFRPGGRWVFTMHGPDGRSYPNESVFVSMESPSSLVIDHVCAPRFRLTIALAARGDDTEIIWEQVFEDAKVAAAVRHIVAPANEQNLDRLQAVLAGL